jgi:NAD(P)-dependent dehydrogenase (short-subunit alcohol dehydrogenase family)
MGDRSRESPMRGSVAIVTGAGAGIGRAIALRLARESAAVVVADVDENKVRPWPEDRC